MRNIASLTLVLLNFLCPQSVAAADKAMPSFLSRSQSSISEDYPSESLKYEISPRRVAPTSWETNVRMAYSDENLLVKVDAMDANPNRIVASQSRYDNISSTDDSIVLSVVTQKSARRAFSFQVNAAGAKGDFISSSSGDGAPNWNGDWTGISTVRSDGYVVEFSIPFSTIGLTADDGVKTIHVNVERQIGRDRGERLSLAPVNLYLPCIECQYTPRMMDFEKEKNSEEDDSGTGIRIQPYAIGSHSERYELTSGKTLSITSDFDMGLDFAWRITPRDVLVGALNPDFSQVEIDAIQFQINQRFVQTLAEKRSFFTNESGVFATAIPLLYTRSIVDPSAGVQFVRRRDSYEFAALVVDDRVTSFVKPTEDASSIVSISGNSRNIVSKLNYRPNGQWRIGGMITSRRNGYYQNFVSSVDTAWSINDSNQFDAQLAISSTCDDQGGRECNDGHALNLSHSFGGKNWNSYSAYSQYSGSFRADLGLINQTGVMDFFQSIGYSRPITKANWIDRFGVNASFNFQHSDRSGLLTRTSTVSASLSTKFSTLSVSVDAGDQFYEGARFSTTGDQVSWSHRLTNRFNYGFSYSHRDAIDFADLRLGVQNSFSINAGFKTSSRIEGRISLSKTNFELPDRPLFETKSASLRSEYHFNSSNHLQLFVNYGESKVFSSSTPVLISATSRSARYQLAYHYKPTPFRYFIFGGSGSMAGNGSVQGMEPASSHFFAKYVFDFSM